MGVEEGDSTLVKRMKRQNLFGLNIIPTSYTFMFDVYFYSRSVVDVFVRYPATSVVDVDAIKLRLAATEQAVRSHIFPDCFLSSDTFPDCSFHQREI